MYPSPWSNDTLEEAGTTGGLKGSNSDAALLSFSLTLRAVIAPWPARTSVCELQNTVWSTTVFSDERRSWVVGGIRACSSSSDDGDEDDDDGDDDDGGDGDDEMVDSSSFGSPNAVENGSTLPSNAAVFWATLTVN